MMRCLLMLCVLPTLLFAAPRIELDPPVYDFGTMENTQSFNQTFAIKNTGDEPLLIRMLRPHCQACTLASMTTNSVPPGASAEVSYSVILHDQPKGLFNKGIRISSNDPKSPNIDFAIKGQVSMQLEITPRSLTLGAVKPGGTATGVVEIVTNNEQPFRVERLESGRGITTGTVEMSEGGKKARITIVLTGNSQPRADNLPAYYLQDTLVAHLDHPTVKHVPITVRGTLKEPIFVSPDQLVLSGIPGTKVARNLLCRTDVAANMKVTADPWPGGADGTTIEILALNPTLSRIGLRNIPVDPALDGKTLVLRTNVPGKEEISIPIRVVIQETKASP